MHQRIDPRREDVGVGQQVRVDVELTRPSKGEVPPEVVQLPRSRGKKPCTKLRQGAAPRGAALVTDCNAWSSALCGPSAASSSAVRAASRSAWGARLRAPRQPLPLRSVRVISARMRSLTSGCGLQHLELVMNELDSERAFSRSASCGLELIQQSSALCIELRPPCGGLSQRRASSCSLSAAERCSQAHPRGVRPR